MKMRPIVFTCIVFAALSGCFNNNNKQSEPQTQQPTPDKDSFIAIIRDLELKTLSVMSVAEKKARKEHAPAFEELKPDLLKFNTEKATQRWEDIYRSNPGWIMEPQGLVFAGKHSMYEPSFQLTQQVNGNIIIHFKTYGNPLYDQAHQVTYILVRTNAGEWKIDSLQAIPLENAFSLDEVKKIMADEVESAEYVKEDDMYYYFKAPKQQSGNQNYVFHKKGGYLDVAPNGERQ